MQDEQALRAKAHAAVLAGKLPARSPDRVWGGPGVGAPCEVCGSPITKDDKEFQIEFEQEGGGGLDKFHVHIRCFAAWEFERKRPAK
jgi:hypothetical protein